MLPVKHAPVQVHVSTSVASHPEFRHLGVEGVYLPVVEIQLVCRNVPHIPLPRTHQLSGSSVHHVNTEENCIATLTCYRAFRLSCQHWMLQLAIGYHHMVVMSFGRDKL